MIHIAPSILAADFAKLGDEVQKVVRGGANRIHVDVMDGHFVPNLSMGPIVVSALKNVTDCPLEVHLMIEEPARYAESFLKAGARSLIVHFEVLQDPKPLLKQIRDGGHGVGLAINPATPVNVFEGFLPLIDVALCMTVWPGFGGQSYLPESEARILELRTLIERINPACELEVDGGIDLATGIKSVEAGANVLVAGTSIFRAADGAEAATKHLAATTKDRWRRGAK